MGQNSGRARRSALWRASLSAGVLLACRGLAGVRAQDSEDACAEVNASGLSEEDGFPSEATVYTNSLGDDVRGEFINGGKTHYIWYSPTDPVGFTVDTPAVDISACTGTWVISTYPVGDAFNDTVWYQSADGAQCDTDPTVLSDTDWVRGERESSSVSETLTEAVVMISCLEEEDDGDDGLSNKTVIVLLIVVGVGFMVLMCLGALACCIKGQNNNEEAIMPPGELTEGSVIGGKADDEIKPGLHAHPEIRGAQHPRPEEWAPAYTSNRSTIPLGSRSGPSVRSIGYS